MERRWAVVGRDDDRHISVPLGSVHRPRRRNYRRLWIRRRQLILPPLWTIAHQSACRYYVFQGPYHTLAKQIRAGLKKLVLYMIVLPYPFNSYPFKANQFLSKWSILNLALKGHGRALVLHKNVLSYCAGLRQRGEKMRFGCNLNETSCIYVCVSEDNLAHLSSSPLHSVKADT